MQDDSNFNKDNWFSNIIRKPDSGVIKSEYKTPIFIDDDKNVQGQAINGVTVLGK